MSAILRLATELVPLVLSGKKTSTVRLGLRRFELGDTEIVAGAVKIPIRILSVEHTLAGSLDEAVAKTEGYSGVDQLLRELSRFYPDIKPNDDVTIIRFVRS